MARLWLIAASVFGFLMVEPGAFAPRSLKSNSCSDLLDTVEKGVPYQMCAALAFLAVVILSRHTKSNLNTWTERLFTAGAIFFSGSLHLLVLERIEKFGAGAPVGSLSWLARPLCLMAAVPGT